MLVLQRYNFFCLCSHLSSPSHDLSIHWIGVDWAGKKIPEHVSEAKKQLLKIPDAVELEVMIPHNTMPLRDFLRYKLPTKSTEYRLNTYSYRTLFFSLRSVLNVILRNFRGWIHVRTNWGYRPECHGKCRTKMAKFRKFCMDKNGGVSGKFGI